MTQPYAAITAAVLLIVGIGALAVYVVKMYVRKRCRSSVLHTVSHMRAFFTGKNITAENVEIYIGFLANMFSDVLDGSEALRLMKRAMEVKRGDPDMGKYLVESVLNIVAAKQINGASAVFQLTREGISIYQTLCRIVAEKGGDT